MLHYDASRPRWFKANGARGVARFILRGQFEILNSFPSEGWVNSSNKHNVTCDMREELLNESMFRNLAHARIVIAAWTADYNAEPPQPVDYQ